MNEESTGKWLRQVEHIRDHYSIKLKQKYHRSVSNIP